MPMGGGGGGGNQQNWQGSTTSLAETAFGFCFFFVFESAGSSLKKRRQTARPQIRLWPKVTRNKK